MVHWRERVYLGIAKMRPGTKRAKKVEDMVKSSLMEEETSSSYVTYQLKTKREEIQVSFVGATAI